MESLQKYCSSASARFLFFLVHELLFRPLAGLILSNTEHANPTVVTHGPCRAPFNYAYQSRTPGDNPVLISQGIKARHKAISAAKHPLLSPFLHLIIE